MLQKMYTTSPRFLPDTADLVCALLQACAETTALGCAFELTSYLERSIGSDGDAKERRNLKATLCKSLGAIKHLLGACIAVGNLDLHATLQSKLAVLGVPLQKMLSSGYAPIPLGSKSLHVSPVPPSVDGIAFMNFDNDMVESPKSIITESLSSSPYDWSTDDYSTC